jgi:hypothetical protein
MKIITLGLKLWLVLALLAALAVGTALYNQSDVGIFYNDEPLGMAGSFAAGACAVLVAALVTALVVAIVGIVVPLTVVAVLVALAIALCVAIVALGGVVLAAGSPILIPLLLCVLLVRFLLHRNPARRARDAQHP